MKPHPSPVLFGREGVGQSLAKICHPAKSRASGFQPRRPILCLSCPHFQSYALKGKEVGQEILIRCRGDLAKRIEDLEAQVQQHHGWLDWCEGQTQQGSVYMSISRGTMGSGRQPAKFGAFGVGDSSGSVQRRRCQSAAGPLP